jgi:signal transduction histidine kinase
MRFQECDFLKYLFVMAHPDDEADLGGTIWRLFKCGHQVAVAIVVGKVSARRNLSETLETEEVQVAQYCEDLMDKIRDKVKSDVTLKVNAPKLSAPIYKEYVSHILLHLLKNAAEYTPEGGHITLGYKKRGAHKHQFIVSDTGCGIPEEQREEVFRAFREIRDLTKGDGLGLPICKRMALNMNGDLDIDPAFAKGVHFVLSLQD